jgi:hypothetical protein
MIGRCAISAPSPTWPAARPTHVMGQGTRDSPAPRALSHRVQRAKERPVVGLAELCFRAGSLAPPPASRRSDAAALRARLDGRTCPLGKLLHGTMDPGAPVQGGPDRAGAHSDSGAAIGIHAAHLALRPSPTGEELVAWVVPSGPVTRAELAAHIRSHLPTLELLPTLVWVSTLPLGPEGHVDGQVLAALPAIDAELIARAEEAWSATPGIRRVKGIARGREARGRAARSRHDSRGDPRRGHQQQRSRRCGLRRALRLKDNSMATARAAACDGWMSRTVITKR